MSPSLLVLASGQTWCRPMGQHDAGQWANVMQASGQV